MLAKLGTDCAPSSPPEWFDDAKFGIFIHWGLFSIPAFASKAGSISRVFREHYDTAVALTPYTEWYWNAVKVPESDSAAHHRSVWNDAPYQDFRQPFLDGLRQWNPDSWADLFVRAGARYVVLVAKHHDGFCLWPSRVANPNEASWTTARDVVGELAAAVRARGLRFGLYYSGGIDWTFNREPLRTLGDFLGSVPPGRYRRYAQSQMRELIDRYEPSVLWNDISWPASLGSLRRLIAYYYARVPEGVVNDRWMPLTWRTRLLRYRYFRRKFDERTKPAMQRARREGVIPPKPPHFDFRTPEYATFDHIEGDKWEATRGMSHSFGYNRRDTEEDYVDVRSLVHGFIDAVSKNGNLLLNVGPRGEDARIPAAQISRLEGFGTWLAANGEGIYGTRPWIRAESKTDSGLGVRFSQKSGSVYAHILGTPPESFTLPDPDLPAASAVLLPNTAESITVQRLANGLQIRMTRPPEESIAVCFRLTGPRSR